MNKTAHDLAVQYCSTLSDETATKATGDAFLAGFQAAEPKWIPVTERLPEDSDQLCLCICDDGPDHSTIAAFHESRHVFKDVYGYSWRVVYWCPIPESLLNFKP